MKKIVDKNFTAFTLSYDEERAVIKTKGKDMEIVFGKNTKDYAFIGHMLFDKHSEEILKHATVDRMLDIHLSTQLISLELIWNEEFKDKVWEIVEAIDKSVEPIEENREEELEIINELKKTHELKEILDKAEPTVE